MFAIAIATLAQNLLLFIAVFVLLAQVTHWTGRLPLLRRQILLGIVLGATAVAAMAMPLEVAPGMYLDGRLVMVALAGPLGGLPAAMIAAALTAGYRWILGGVGLPVATANIVLIATVGVAVARWMARRGDRLRIVHLAGLGAAATTIQGIGHLLFLKVDPHIALSALLATAIGIPLLGTLMLDETRKQELLAMLKRSEDRFRGIVTNLPGAVLRRVRTAADELHYDYVSPSSVGLFGLTPEEIVASPERVAAAMAPEDALAWRAIARQSAATLSPCTFDCRVATPDGERWVRLHSTPHREAGGDIVWDEVAIDVTAHKQAELELRNANLDLQEEIRHREVAEQVLRSANAALTEEIGARRAAEAERDKLIAELERLSDTDQLTGCLNRRGFLKMAQREMDRLRRTGSAVSLIVLDVDRFKSINDTHGHHVGDHVLTAIAHLCRSVVRSVDAVARIGGEEFVVLLPDTAEDGATLVASRLRSEIEQTAIVAAGRALSVTASFGVSSTASGVVDLAMLLREADAALYRAKGGGRNRVERASICAVREILDEQLEAGIFPLNPHPRPATAQSGRA